MSIASDVAVIIKKKDVSSGQMPMLLAAEEKRKKLIERGILKKTERRVALPGEKIFIYSNDKQ